MFKALKIIFTITLALIALGGSAVATEAATSTVSGALSVTLTSGDGAAVGQMLPMSISTTNTTASPIDSVRLSVSWPQANAKLVAPLPNPDLCGRVGNGGTSMLFSCFMGTLQPGASITIPFAMQPLVADTLQVSGGQSTTNNVFFQTITGLNIPVAAAPTDVQVSGSASTGSPTRGTNFSYSFQVKNGGSQPAYGVTFTDSLPVGETLIAARTDSFAPCTVSDGTATCNLGDLAVGGQVLVVVGVTAPSTPMVLTNTASATATNGDTQPRNNSISVTVQVK